MDFDPRNVCNGHGWSCNFHFGHGHDVIFEDAENEKSCVQVLRYMIAKADDDIHDLEDELAILQCQLKWSDSDNQRDSYEVCCATFEQKIDSLTSSIQRLRNKNETSRNFMDEDLEIQGPTERIYDIINTLIRHNFRDPREQAEFTVSEESSSNAARYAVEDTKEEIYMAKSDNNVTRKVELDAYRFTFDEKSGAVALKHAITQTHHPASTSEGHSKLEVVQQGVSRKCVTESETGQRESSSLLAQEINKAEENDYVDICTIDSFPKLQDQERDIPDGDHLEVIKNRSQSVVDAHITNDEMTSNLSSILKPQEWKVQRKRDQDLDGVTQSSSASMLEPLKTTGKAKSSSNPKNSAQSGSSLKEEGKFLLLQETDILRKVRVSGAKRQHIQGIGEESGNVVSPVYDLEYLRLKISQDPIFLNRLKIPQLREIAKKNKLIGFSKLKKEKLIEALIKQLPF